MSSATDGEESVVGELPTFDIEASPASSMVKQIEAFSSLAEDSQRHFNLDSLHTALEYLVECPFVGTPRRVQNKSQGGMTTRRSMDSTTSVSETESEIESVSSLYQIRALLIKWRRKCGKTRNETDYVNRLERFFREIQYQRRLARYFVQRIYVPLYKRFFDINLLSPGSESHDDVNADEEQSAFFLTECAIADESSSTNNEIPQFSSVNDHLEHVIHRLAVLHTKWTNVLKDETVFSEEFLEPNSAVSVETLEKSVTNPRLLLALRMLPDLFEKCALASSLAMEWLGINENVSSSEKKKDSPENLGEDQKEELLRSVRKDLMKKESDIRKGEHSLDIYQTELKQLNEREERVLALCHNCGELEIHREKIGDEYQAKIESRMKMMAELENTIQGSQRFRELSASIKALESEINNQYGELKLVEYALNIAANDYDLHMNVQPSFYAYSRTTKDKIDRTQRELVKHRQDKEKLEQKYDSLNKQFEQMELVMAQAMSEDDNEKDRPGTNETYTKFRIDDRYSDKGQNSDNSLAATDCETESGHDADDELPEDAKPPKQPSVETGRPKARASEFPFWPIHSGPGTLVNHSAPLSQ